MSRCFKVREVREALCEESESRVQRAETPLKLHRTQILSETCTQITHLILPSGRTSRTLFPLTSLTSNKPLKETVEMDGTALGKRTPQTMRLTICQIESNAIWNRMS
eukprot:GHVN01093787.1.p2 GENE.GHVN01093787.1~~GHVN01093787.1.p2  ORF type:complete len:107 (+),score=14.57 GHVN01093787.1:167-487(+)